MSHSVASQVRQYMLLFKTNQNTERFLSVMFDELLSPLFLIFFPDINDDPLSEKYTDAVSLKILGHYSKTIFSHKKDSGWEICIQM